MLLFTKIKDLLSVVERLWTRPRITFHQSLHGARIPPHVPKNIARTSGKQNLMSIVLYYVGVNFKKILPI